MTQDTPWIAPPPVRNRRIPAPPIRACRRRDIGRGPCRPSNGAVPVHGIEPSEHMVERLRDKVDEGTLPVTLGLGLRDVITGFSLESRHADRRGGTFVAESPSQVSVYRLPTAG